ncbi:hypothetical protein [Bradyrhizobium sp.]|uniref:hypothetical protein n=1 Tax=Bradyrhizobium sp. TaxID=376 RepID=UPI0039E65653
MSQDPLDGWLAESFRLSFLGVPGWNQRAIFKDIAGTDPTSTSIQQMSQLHQEAADIGDVHLNVVQQQNRVDILLGDKPSQNTVNPLMPGYKPFFSMGPFRESLETFDGLTEKALGLFSNAMRVAYAIILIRPTSTPQESIRALHKLLPKVPIDPNNDSELVFQINRPVRDSNGLLINRIAKWEALQVTAVRLNAFGGLIPTLPTPPASAAQIQIDVNTDAANIVPLNNLSEIVRELRQNAVNLAGAGEA